MTNKETDNQTSKKTERKPEGKENIKKLRKMNFIIIKPTFGWKDVQKIYEKMSDNPVSQTEWVKDKQVYIEASLSKLRYRKNLQYK